MRLLLTIIMLISTGASAWNKTRKKAYANHMKHNQHLIAVKAAINRSKSDMDPSDIGCRQTTLIGVPT